MRYDFSEIPLIKKILNPLPQDIEKHIYKYLSFDKIEICDCKLSYVYTFIDKPGYIFFQYLDDTYNKSIKNGKIDLLTNYYFLKKIKLDEIFDITLSEIDYESIIDNAVKSSNIFYIHDRIYRILRLIKKKTIELNKKNNII